MLAQAVIWLLGLLFFQSPLYVMDVWAPEKDTLLTIPLVEYARDEQYSDQYLYKGLPPQNYLVKTKLSVLKHCEVLTASQCFNKVQQSLDAQVSAFVDVLPCLPSGRTDPVYLENGFLELSQFLAVIQTKSDSEIKTQIDRWGYEWLIDLALDVDWLGVDKANFMRFMDGVAVCLQDLGDIQLLLENPLYRNKRRDLTRITHKAPVELDTILQQCEYFTRKQNFDAHKGVSVDLIEMFVQELPHLPSASAVKDDATIDYSYLYRYLLPVMRKVIEPKSYSDRMQFLDALIDIDYLAFDQQRLKEYIKACDKKFQIFSDPAWQTTEQAKDKLRQVAQMVGKELPSDIFDRELQRIVDIRNSQNQMFKLCLQEEHFLKKNGYLSSADNLNKQETALRYLIWQPFFKTVVHNNILDIKKLQISYSALRLCVQDLVDIPYLKIKISNNDTINKKIIQQANILRAQKVSMINLQKRRINTIEENSAKVLIYSGLMMGLSILFQCDLLFCLSIPIFCTSAGISLSYNELLNKPLLFVNQHCPSVYHLLTWYEPHEITYV